MRAKSNERRYWALGALGLAAGIAVFVAPSSGCNDHVFDIIDQDCVRTLEEDLLIDEEVPADILLVIDNSGSMCEEQGNLAANFFNPSPACPITDLNNVPPRYRNPDNETVAGDLAECGFIQLLAAYDNEFRVGIISTDVGPCDNRHFRAEDPDSLPLICAGRNFPDWGRRPQRGCLQAPPGAERKFIQKGDENIGERFNETIANIQTFGSPFERGLDAMEVFLDPTSTRAEGCSGDRDAFMRDNAKLIVIFLSDEQDCSHADGEYGFVDENAGDVCDASVEETYPHDRTPAVDSSECYTKFDNLAPVDRYVDFLKNLKEGRDDLVSSAVIAGAVFNEEGTIVPGGCTIQANGNPGGNCRESRGNSFQNGPGDICDPNSDAGPCCAADSGSRYFDFANQLGNSLTDSICYSSFRQTMVEIAKFIAAKDTVLLGEAPANEREIQVYLCANGEEDLNACQLATRIPPDANTPGQNGWQLAGDRTVKLYGTAIPQPGQLVKVFARAQREVESGGCTSAAE